MRGRNRSRKEGNGKDPTEWEQSMKQEWVSKEAVRGLVLAKDMPA